MEHYICHKSYTPKTRTEILSDTVEFFSKPFNMLDMSSIDETFHAAQDLICALKNPSPAKPLAKI